MYSLGISFFLATLLFDFHKSGSWKRQQGYSDYLNEDNESSVTSESVILYTGVPRFLLHPGVRKVRRGTGVFHALRRITNFERKGTFIMGDTPARTAAFDFNSLH